MTWKPFFARAHAKLAGVTLTTYGSELNVMFGDDVIGHTGWKRGQKVRLFIGDREDSGWVRIVDGGERTLTQTGKNGAIRLRFRAASLLCDEKFIKTQLRWRPTVGGVEFAVPQGSAPRPLLLAIDVVRGAGHEVTELSDGEIMLDGRRISRKRFMERATRETT